MHRTLAGLLATALVLHVVACSPGQPEIYLEAQRLIDGYAGNLDRLGKAEILLDELHRQDPRSPFPWMGWGRIVSKGHFLGGKRYARADSREKAHELFRKARMLGSDLPDAWVFSAYPYLHQRDFENARKMAERAESLAPNSPRVHLLYAYMAKLDGDHAEIVRRCTRAIETTDDPALLSDAHAKLARAHSKLKHEDLAEASYRAVIELEPDSPWAHSNFSRFLTAADRFDEAIAEARRALELMNFVRGHEMLAYAYYSKGAHLYWDLEQPDEAAPWFVLAIEENPRSANSFYALSRVRYDRAENGGGRNDLVLSRALLDRALQLEPEHPQALRHLERLREHAGYASQGGEAAAQGLRAEVATLFERLDREQGVLRLGEALTQGIQGARIRGIRAYEHSILRYGEPAFDLEKLRGGQLPYLSKGDFDCDGTEDQAVLLAEPTRMVALRLGNGTTRALPQYDGDVLETASPGSVVTAAGKGIGSPAPGTPERFEAHCDFVSVLTWGRSAYAVVYEPESGSFQRFWTAD